MLHSRDFGTSEIDETELRHLYERALGRSAQLRARQIRRRAAAGTAALACLVVAGLVTASLAATNPVRRTTNGSSVRPTVWRLVSEVSAAGSSWQKLSPSGYQQTFALVCPSNTTCYADSLGGQLEYTHDGGSSWQHATGTGTATSLPQISCVTEQDCDVLADIAGSGSTFLTTTDGGQTWTSQPGPRASLGGGPASPGSPSQHGLAQDAMSCATISSCVVIAYRGGFAGSSTHVFATSDGGASWSKRRLPAPASGQFLPSGLSCTGTSCVAVGSIVGRYTPREPGSGQAGAAQQARGVSTLAGAAYHSDDGGATWSASSRPPHGAVVTSLTCPDATDCFALSPSAIVETQNGGQSWHTVSTAGLRGPSGSSSGWGFISLSCANSSSCWLTGAGGPSNRSATSANSAARQSISIGQVQGLLASTADGGSTWAMSKVPAGVGGVIDVTCPQPSTCFALAVEQTGSARSDSTVVLLTNAS